MRRIIESSSVTWLPVQEVKDTADEIERLNFRG